MNKCFSYVNNILYYVERGEDCPITEFNVNGGNGCGKSYAIQEILTYLCSKPGVMCYVFRKERRQLLDLWNDFIAMLDENGFVYKIHKTEMYIEVNGGKIYFHYLTVKNKENQLSLTTARKCRYVFVYLEEAYEFTQKDIDEIEIRVRGDLKTQMIYFKVCNPFSLGNDYIAYMNSNLRYNKDVLIKYGQQIKIDKENGKLFHYSNWRIASHKEDGGVLENDFQERYVLTKQKIKSITDTWVRNRRLAMTRDWGVPGMIDGGIYQDALSKMRSGYWRKADAIYVGIDTGYGETEKDSGINSAHFVLYSENLGYDCVAEYTLDKKSKDMTIAQIIKEIWVWANETYNIYLEKTGDYDYMGNKRPKYIYIDGADQAGKEYLDVYNERYGNRWDVNGNQRLKCKITINERIEKITSGLTNGYIRIISDNCPELIRALSISKLVKNSSGDKMIRSMKSDHPINSLEYALLPTIRENSNMYL